MTSLLKSWRSLMATYNGQTCSCCWCSRLQSSLSGYLTPPPSLISQKGLALLRIFLFMICQTLSSSSDNGHTTPAALAGVSVITTPPWPNCPTPILFWVPDPPNKKLNTSKRTCSFPDLSRLTAARPFAAVLTMFKSILQLLLVFCKFNPPMANIAPLPYFSGYPIPLARSWIS